MFHVVAEQGRTDEKRLHIGIHSINESYSAEELTKLGWLSGALNPAGSMTKCKVRNTPPLMSNILDKKVSIKPVGWSNIVTRKQKLASVNYDGATSRDATAGHVRQEKGGCMDFNAVCAIHRNV